MSNNLEFIRSDLKEFSAYTSHPGGKVKHPVDRLDTNESPEDLPPEIKEKLNKIYLEKIEANRYPDGSHQELKKSIAEYVRESGNINDITSENISIGNGSDELIRSILIATCLGDRGSILVANPTFSMYGILAKTLGIKVTSIQRNEKDFSIDINAAKEAITNTEDSPIKVIFVVHPNSPTANSLTEKEIEWLKSVPENILVVVDEAYFEFSKTSLVSQLNKHKNWIVMRTFSKAFRLAAHRVGYAIANKDLISILEKVRLPYNLPSFSQCAALTVLENRKIILPLVDKIIEERIRVENTLSKNTQIITWKSNANFIYLRPNTSDRRERDKQLISITNNLKDRGTLIRHTGGGLRITIGTPEENNRTLERFKIIQ